MKKAFDENMSTFQMPPQIYNQNGELRKVGFEFEFTGIDLRQLAHAITKLYGGEYNRKNRFKHLVVDTIYGDFSLEMDSNLLKNRTYKKFLQKFDIDINKFLNQSKLDKSLEKIAALVVPYELAVPPLPINDIHTIETMRSTLQQLKALGTRASVVYAFGLHINIEAPALDVQTLSNYLRAYLLLHHWIVKESDIDFTRRIAPFIDEFPEDYMRLILDSSYNPSRDELITDYHEHNPTRNRPLDMLPIFTHVNRQLIGDFSDELVKPRPTFHYRLPNCLIDDPNWTVAREWDYWVAVEKLANEPDKIAQMSKQYFEITNSFSFSVKDKWYNEVIKWM